MQIHQVQHPAYLSILVMVEDYFHSRMRGIGEEDGSLVKIWICWH